MKYFIFIVLCILAFSATLFADSIEDALILKPVPVVSGVRGTPVVNGIFYGDGDEDNYYFLAENDITVGGPSRATLWYNLIGDSLFVAVVVSSSVNDNVMANKKQQDTTNPDYLASVQWQRHHTASDLIGSDNMGMEFTCGANTWTWTQDLVYEDAVNSYWLSDHLGTDGLGTPPPNFTSSSSSAWNLNYTNWDVTYRWYELNPGGSPPSTDDWRSPYVIGHPETLAPPYELEYPYYDSINQWEWALVYEMKFNVATCGSSPLQFSIVSAHNSPSKDSEEDVPFEPVDLMDYGDLPDVYATYLGSDGARHYIVVNNPYLGEFVDAEPDGQPDTDAEGDDTFDYTDDEDGVIFTSYLVPGFNADVTITASTSAYLNGWVDFNGDGDLLDPGEQVFTDVLLLPGENYLQISVPASANTGLIYSRFRFSSDTGLAPYGLASDGEVEDYALTIQEGFASLGDYVWNDLTNDGIQDPWEPGLYAATVNLYQVGNPVAIATTTTDNNGYYIFSNLLPGDYYVEFLAPGWTPSPINTTSDDLDSDADLTTGMTGIYTLVAGEHNPTVDAGFYGGDPLPVILSSFQVSYTNNIPILQWTTQSESGNSYWNIYRSISQNLGQGLQINPENIPGTGTSSEPTNYFYEDQEFLDFIFQNNLQNINTFWYWIESVSVTGETELHGPISLLIPDNNDPILPPEIPGQYGLYQNYPNPFNPYTEISFNISRSCLANLEIFNMKGEKIRTLFKNQVIQGDRLYRVTWDATDENNKTVSSGIYFYHLRTNTQESFTRKMILAK